MAVQCFSVPGLREIQAENLSKMADALDEVRITSAIKYKIKISVLSVVVFGEKVGGTRERSSNYAN